jgi:hypothetical protein
MTSVAEQLIGHISERLGAFPDVGALAGFAAQMVGQLLQRDEDAILRGKTLDKVAAYFKTAQPTAAGLQEARDFAIEVISIIVQIRHPRGAPHMTPVEIDAVYASFEDPDNAPVRGQATEPTRIITVPPPPPELHPEFDRVLAAALKHKVGQILTFFQRWNPRVFRQMPQPFLLSTGFGAALDKAIDEVIAPAMLESRTVRHIGTLYRWAEIDSVKFWEVAAEGGHVEALKKSWHAVWDEMRPQAVQKGDKKVLRAGPQLLRLRKMLASEQYAMPEIRTREIDLFASFIEPDCTRRDLESAWTKLRQIYEQELDRRFYQDKARTGALRDSLLDCFEPFSPRTAEFLALLCYRNFPYLTLGFLIAFTLNHGSDVAARQKRIPFLMWFLDLPQAGEAAAADEDWIAEATVRDDTRVREAEKRAEEERNALMGGVVWSLR